MSASASEIFAGAIKDYNRGILVGTRTFGKGTVQALQGINNGQLKLTNAKFYRISGKSTQNKGVSPDIFYPMLYNPEDIGESALDGALPWDMSHRAEFIAYRDLAPAIEKLGIAHEQRTISNPGFTYLRERYDLTTEIYNVREWSLNETKRRLEKEQFKTMELAIENRLRISRSLAPLESLEQKATRTKDVDPEKDILLKETELIMVDFIDISKNQGLIW
jgi:carboxyl-terminal processing protease